MWPDEEKKYKITESRKMKEEECEGNAILEEIGWMTKMDTPFGELVMISYRQPTPKMIDKYASEAIYEKEQQTPNDQIPNTTDAKDIQDGDGPQQPVEGVRETNGNDGEEREDEDGEDWG